VELCKHGVFASAVIKKRRYWPKHVPGTLMDARMTERDIGETDYIQGVLGVSHPAFLHFFLKVAA
jgi:hypothetical protein